MWSGIRYIGDGSLTDGWCLLAMGTTTLDRCRQVMSPLAIL